MNDENDILRLKKWEAQEAVGFLTFLERSSLDPFHSADFDTFPISQQSIVNMDRDKFYRLAELDPTKQLNLEQHQKLYSQFIELTNPDLTIHGKDISLIDGIKYKLYVPCSIRQEDSKYVASILRLPESSYIFIFDSNELIANLVLNGFYTQLFLN